LILNVVLVGILVASHESDQVKVPANHAMEDATLLGDVAQVHLVFHKDLSELGQINYRKSW
jgi:hypothetical protein